MAVLVALIMHALLPLLPSPVSCPPIPGGLPWWNAHEDPGHPGQPFQRQEARGLHLARLCLHHATVSMCVFA